MFPHWSQGSRIAIMVCVTAGLFVGITSRAQSHSILFPSASIDSASMVNLYWYSPGARDTATPSLPDPPVAWLESPAARAWVAAARIESPVDSTVLYALDVQLKFMADFSPIAVGLRCDTGAPGSALGPAALLEPVPLSGNTYRVHLDTPVHMRAATSFFACIYWSSTDRFALGEGHAVAGSAFAAFQSGYVVSQWQPWSDYSLAVSGVFALPFDANTATIPQGDSVILWRHSVGNPDSSQVTTTDARDLHCSDQPPFGRDVEYTWNHVAGTRITSLAVPVARATALQWLNLTPPTGGLKDASQISATLRNWSDSSLQVAILATCSWSASSPHSGQPPQLDPADSVIAISPRSETAISVGARVDNGSIGLAFVRIEATDRSPFHARVAMISDSIPVGSVGVDDGVGGERVVMAPWPNPCRGVLHIPGGRSAELVNLLGRRVARYDTRTSDSDGIWDVGSLGLPAGVYWLRVRGASGTRVHQFTFLK